jgi:anti-sigma B factor antagonist
VPIAVFWRRFEFHKHSQLFIRVHNETLSVVAMRVCNKERSPVFKEVWVFARIASHFPLRRKSMISLAKGGRVSRHVIWIALVMLSLPPVMAKRYSGPEITAAFVFAPMIHWLSKGWMKKSASRGVATPRKDRPNVLPLKGEIDLHVYPAVMASLNAMIKKKPKRLVVDLSRVTYVDSTGLAAFIRAMQKVEAYGGKFSLAGVPETVRSIFEMSRLDQVFKIFPDVDTAMSG